MDVRSGVPKCNGAGETSEHASNESRSNRGWQIRGGKTLKFRNVATRDSDD